MGGCREVAVPGSWGREAAVHYAVAVWFGRRPRRVKMLDPRLYLVELEDVEFVVVVSESGGWFRVKLVEGSLGPRGARVM